MSDMSPSFGGSVVELILSWVGLPLVAAIALGLFEVLTRAEENYRKDMMNQEHWFINESRKARRKNYAIILIVASSINLGYMAGVELNKLFE